jgi:2'-hydroxyisoflavone reductase
MMITRRTILRCAALAGTAVGLAGSRPRAQDSEADDPVAPPPGAKLRLLVLGGTGFLGPHVVEAALARGHEVTLFNRGKTNPGLFPDLEKLRGDRDPEKDEGLSALEGRDWDAVVDTSAYVPRIASASAELLADAVAHYVLISTISVYAGFAEEGMDEDAPTGTIDDESVETVDGATYGPLKALCERAVEAAMPGRTTSIRPGLIVGPLDPTGRFTYWPVRVERGGEVLAPGDPSDPVQFIDARDLAAFVVHAIEERTTGTFNATGPATELSIAELLHGCKAVTGGSARFTWVPAAFLRELEVSPWSDLPVWVPGGGDSRGLTRIDVSRAVAAGLTFRPLARTVADTLEWYHGEPEERRARLVSGLAPEREGQVLAAWHEEERRR